MDNKVIQFNYMYVSICTFSTVVYYRILSRFLGCSVGLSRG